VEHFELDCKWDLWSPDEKYDAEMLAAIKELKEGDSVSIFSMPRKIGIVASITIQKNEKGYSYNASMTEGLGDTEELADSLGLDVEDEMAMEILDEMIPKDMDGSNGYTAEDSNCNLSLEELFSCLGNLEDVLQATAEENSFQINSSEIADQINAIVRQRKLELV
jgi:hypothetical protein